MIEPAILLDAWATTMWRACWQGSLIVLTVWSICQLMPSMPARLQCWFWRLVVLKFVLVLFVPFAIDLPLLPATAACVSNAPVASSLSALDVDQAQSGQIRTGLPLSKVVLCLAWVIGVGWNLTRLLAAWHAVGHLRRRSHAIGYFPMLQQLAVQQRLFGLRTTPELLEIVGYGSPMLIGILRPAIVVPAETRRRLNACEQAMVLGHELAHIRRGDLLWNIVAALVRAVFFFHPLVWLSERRLNMAQEIAADDLAIARQQQNPVGYGKLLVSVVSKLGPGQLLPMMSMGTAGPMDSLKRRLSAMKCFGRESRRVVATSGILLGTVILLGLVPWTPAAAKPQDGENRSMQRVVTIKISEGEKNEPKLVLYAPKIIFVPGHDAMLQMGDKSCRLELVARSLPKKKPMEHVIQVKLIREGKSPVVLTTPKLTLLDGRTGRILFEGPNTLEIEAPVGPVE